MIEVTKMSGEHVFVNADHIESVEAQPDTVLVLANGKHILVREKPADVVGRIVAYQQLVRSGLMAAEGRGAGPHAAGDAGDDGPGRGLRR